MNDAEASPWRELMGAVVVLDIRSPFVYVGTLVGFHGGFLLLKDADAHDLRDSATTREKYVMENRRHGVSPNRHQTWVNTAEVVGVSRLEDIVVD